MATAPRVALIVPCYNESESLPITIKELIKLQKSLQYYSLDVIFVNDGSSDNTQELIEQAAEKSSHIFYIEFAANAGHQSALRAGINAAVGYDAAVMMDADLQHPPDLVPKMLRMWQDGTNIIQMIRNDSAKDLGRIRYLVGYTYYKFINFISDLKLEYGASDFRLIDGSIIELVAKSNEQNLFLRGYFSWLPVTRKVVKYKPAERVAGKSKYSLKKLIKLSYNSILQFSEKPLRISLGAGVLMALLAFFYAVFLILMYFLGEQSVSGWVSLMTALLFLFGLNFMLIGIIGHYLGHSIGLVKQRPEFVVLKQKLQKQSNRTSE